MSKTSSTISRRSALRRIGAGAALAWSAPTLSTLGSSAHAQGPTPACAEPCNAACDDFEEGGPAQCGDGAVFPCFCSRNTLNECYCWEDAVCEDLVNCTPGPCPPGTVCTSSCCDQAGGAMKCLPVCGQGTDAPIVGGAAVIRAGQWASGLKL